MDTIVGVTTCSLILFICFGIGWIASGEYYGRKLRAFRKEADKAVEDVREYAYGLGVLDGRGSGKLVTVSVNVTQQDIDSGRDLGGHLGGSNAPVALALRRIVLPGYLPVVAGGDLDHIALCFVSVYTAWLKPAPAQVAEFNTNLRDFVKVKPFTFLLKLPEHMVSRKAARLIVAERE